jgi:hypothetical protein
MTRVVRRRRIMLAIYTRAHTPAFLALPDTKVGLKWQRGGAMRKGESRTAIEVEVEDRYCFCLKVLIEDKLMVDCVLMDVGSNNSAIIQRISTLTRYLEVKMKVPSASYICTRGGRIGQNGGQRYSKIACPHVENQIVVGLKGSALERLFEEGLKLV